MLHFNYFNILPIILFEVFLVYIFEYLIFLYDIIPHNLKITTNYLSTLKNYFINNSSTPSPDNKINENNYISTKKKDSILIISFTCFGIVLALLLYNYIVVNIFKKNIDWILILMNVLGILLLIIFTECIYIFVIEEKLIYDKKHLDYLILINNKIIDNILQQKS